MRALVTTLAFAGFLAAVCARGGTPPLARDALQAFSLTSDPRFPIGYRVAQDARNRAVEALKKSPPPEQAQALAAIALELKSKNARVAAQAATCLGALSEISAPEERALLQALRRPELDLKRQAAQALGAMRDKSRLAADLGELLEPDLKSQLSSPRVRRRLEGLVTLSLLGNAAQPFCAQVIPMLRDPEPPVRAAAAQTLGGLPDCAADSAPALRQWGLKDTEVWVRAEVLTSLGKLGEPARPAVPQLVAALRAREPELRDAARSALGMLGARAADAVPTLNAWLSDPDEQVRARAAETLARLGGVAAPALPALAKAVGDPDGETQRNAVWALASIGAPARAALPELEELLLHAREPGVRKNAASALSRLPQLADAGVPLLLRAMRDDDPEVRGAVAQALADLGSLARTALPRLREWLGDSSAEARKLGAATLGRMGSEAARALQELRKQAESDPDPDARIAAIQALGTTRVPGQAQAPRESLAILLGDLRSPETRYKLAALTALQSTPVVEALPGAQAALGDPSPSVREAAAGAITALGERAKPALPALIRLLADPEPAVSRRATSAMTQLAPVVDETSLRAILALLDDAKAPEAQRLNALKALCRLERYAAPASMDLRALLSRKRESSRLRAHAAFALRIIGPQPPAVEREISALLKSKADYFEAIDF